MQANAETAKYSGSAEEAAGATEKKAGLIKQAKINTAARYIIF
jgi:hypothetical protein